MISEVMGWRHISHQLLYLLPTYLRSRTKLHISYLPINPLNSLPSIVPMVRALLSLTSDMRRRAPNLSLAWAELSMNGLVLTHTSSLYETKRQHLNEQPFFFNAACAIETSLRRPPCHWGMHRWKNGLVIHMMCRAIGTPPIPEGG